MQTTEELKRAMYERLAETWEFTSPYCTGGKRLKAFESALEEYLERLRVEWVELDHKARMSSVLQDAYDRQCQLTRHACQVERETWALNHDLKGELEQARDRIEDLERSVESSLRIAQESTNTNRLAGEELRRRGEIIEQQRQEIDASHREADGLLSRLRMYEAQNRACENSWLPPTTSHQDKRENAQETPAAKPQGHLAMFNWLIRICRGLK